jgi:hypothetical protein
MKRWNIIKNVWKYKNKLLEKIIHKQLHHIIILDMSTIIEVTITKRWNIIKNV